MRTFESVFIDSISPVAMSLAVMLCAFVYLLRATWLWWRDG